MRGGALGIALGIAVVLSAACDGRAPAPPRRESRAAPVTSRARADVSPGAPQLDNLAAYIPAQCYAQTQAPGGRVRNACATCHQASRAPNFVDDGDLQVARAMPRYATENRWANALHPPAPAAIDDAALLAWVRTDNYHDAAAPRPRAAGCAFAPDAAGWDRDPRGALTGWRAYAYAPLPGMFWPTNGSAGDAYIRLPEPYRRDARGAPSLAIYAVNLAIAEAMMRRTDVAIAPADEAALGVDLDGDGRLGRATRVAFAWPPAPGRALRYVGQASALDPTAAGSPVAGLLPTGTELIHSLRYLDVEAGRVRPAARMKEVRYMRKARWMSYAALDLAAKAEAREADQSPDALRRIYGDGEHGVGTGGGWRMQGFIEAADGRLRAQTTEETAACIGCHGGVGASVDNTFSFARKVGGGDPDAGWYAWGARGFTPLAEPVRADGRGEYATWLADVGAGDDFASNAELARRWFGPDGKPRPALLRTLARDITALIVPSPGRALALDRAYLAIVRAQSYAHGRDAFVGTPAVDARVVQDSATGVREPLAPPWQAPARRSDGSAGWERAAQPACFFFILEIRPSKPSFSMILLNIVR